MPIDSPSASAASMDTMMDRSQVEVGTNETCLPCRISKVRCDKVLPCSRCRRRKMTCIAQTKGKRRHRRRHFIQPGHPDDQSAFGGLRGLREYDAGVPARAMLDRMNSAHLPYQQLSLPEFHPQAFRVPNDVVWQQQQQQQLAQQQQQQQQQQQTHRQSTGASAIFGRPANKPLWQPPMQSEWSGHPPIRSGESARGGPFLRQPAGRYGEYWPTSIPTTAPSSNLGATPSDLQGPQAQPFGRGAGGAFLDSSGPNFPQQLGPHSSLPYYANANAAYERGSQQPVFLGYRSPRTARSKTPEDGTSPDQQQVLATGLRRPAARSAMEKIGSPNFSSSNDRPTTPDVGDDEISKRPRCHEQTAISASGGLESSAEQPDEARSKTVGQPNNINNMAANREELPNATFDEPVKAEPGGVPSLDANAIESDGNGTTPHPPHPSSLSRVRAAFEESQLCTDDDSELGPQLILSGWLRVLPYEGEINHPRVLKILIHLSQVSIIAGHPRLLKNALRIIDYLGSLSEFADALAISLDNADDVDVEELRRNSAGVVCPFPAWQNGLDTHVCPVLYMTVCRGELVECDANDVFKANIVESVGDEDNLFELMAYVFDEADFPILCDALLRAYAHREPEVWVAMHFHKKVVHNAGWMCGKLKPATTQVGSWYPFSSLEQRVVVSQVRIQFRLSSCGDFAAYSLCMLPFNYDITNSLKRKHTLPKSASKKASVGCR